MSTLSPEIPKIFQKMSLDEKQGLKDLLEKKAWYYASNISPLTDEEEAQVEKIRRKYGERAAKKASGKLYNRHHWRSLRWFLFGGLVDVPDLPSDPRRAYDPVDNPWVKIRVPGWAVTTDEHDQANPHKKLPDKDYLRLLAYAWVHEPLLAIPKSRQMMVTWLFCSIAVHEIMARNSTATAWISKKYDDAAAHIEHRIQAVANRLPSDRFWVPEFSHKNGYLTCKDTGSYIQAMGEEAKGLRQYTFSWVFDDEAAFQDQASAIVQAALPTTRGGGRFTLVSSANGKEVFHGVVSENKRIALPPGP